MQKLRLGYKKRDVALITIVNYIIDLVDDEPNERRVVTESASEINPFFYSHIYPCHILALTEAATQRCS